MNTRFTARMEQLRKAPWWALVEKGRHDGLFRGLTSWVALALLISGGPALGDTPPSLLPPSGNYVVKWYDATGTPPVANWDVEVTPFRDESARFVSGAQVIPELSCWAVDVPVGEPSAVRIRTVSDTQVSSWSSSTSVPRSGTDYRVKWYQPPGATSALGWELEITPVRDANARFVIGAQVMSERSCWALPVPVGEPSSARIRPVSGTVVSPWSAYTTVPEPGFALTSLTAFGFLTALARRRQRSGAGAYSHRTERPGQAHPRTDCRPAERPREAEETNQSGRSRSTAVSVVTGMVIAV